VDILARPAYNSCIWIVCGAHSPYERVGSQAIGVLPPLFFSILSLLLAPLPVCLIPLLALYAVAVYLLVMTAPLLRQLIEGIASVVR